MTQPKSKSVVELQGTIVNQTPRAILFIVDLDTHEFETDTIQKESIRGIWFPFSQCTEIHTASPGIDSDGKDRLVVTRWIAKQKGISC